MHRTAPGRTCGPCVACCVHPRIDLPWGVSPAGVPCRHVSAGACAVYADRPGVCRSATCGYLAELTERRPDETGCILAMPRDGVGVVVSCGWQPAERVVDAVLELFRASRRRLVEVIVDFPGSAERMELRIDARRHHSRHDVRVQVERAWRLARGE